jgi:hypothetical protein
MDTAPSYHVIFSGKLREGFEPLQVKQAITELLKLPKREQQHLFSGKQLVLKRTDSAEVAKNMVAALASVGAIARIQSNSAAKRDAASPEKSTPSATLAKFSPYPRGGRLIASLILAATTELLLDLLYLLLLLSGSVGLLYSSLFTTWGMTVVNFGPLALLLQVVALLLGVVVLFLIAKPLLSCRQPHHHGILLTPEQEPDLHAFVEDVCERIGAPPPQEVRINNDVGVELGYLHGVPGFLLNRSVLTIGAPLAAITDTSQLAALIAQSLQLFHSKQLSPRAAFLLRGSDRWLQRAIYGQDVIDHQLADLLTEKRPYPVVVAALQQLIAISRAVQSLRLRLSRRLNRRLIHRLVADADKVSLIFTGSAGFTALIEQQRLLNFIAQNILPGLRERWLKEGLLPDNLVQSMLVRCSQYPASIHQQLRTTQEQEKAASRDTIPSDRQRLRRVSKMTVTAAYPCHSPATGLFRNFDKLAKTMTVRLYHNRLDIPVNPSFLSPVAAPEKQVQQQQQQIDAIFQQLYRDFIPLKLRHRMKMISDYDEAIEQRTTALEEMITSRAHAELALKRCIESEQALINLATQELMYRANLWRQWGVGPVGSEELEHLHTTCREQEKGLDENIGVLSHQLTPYMQFLAATLMLLDTPQADKMLNARALLNEVTTLDAVLERIEQSQPHLRALHLHTTLLQTLLSYDDGKHGKLRDHIKEQATGIQSLLPRLGTILKTTPYPFNNTTPHDNLMAFALRHAYPDEGPDGDLDRGNELVEQISSVQRHILARLCAIALHVEKTLAI